MGISRGQLIAGVVGVGVGAVLAVGVGRLWSHHSQLNRFDGIVTALQESGESRVLEGKKAFVCYNTAGTGGMATDGSVVSLKTSAGIVTAAKTEDPLLQILSAITAKAVPHLSFGMPSQQIFGLDGGAKLLGSFEKSLRDYCPNTNGQPLQETAPTPNGSTFLIGSFLGQGSQKA
jgi:hypothetical protein